MITIYIDADACPVKDEVYRVAERYQIPVLVVANSAQRWPAYALAQLKVVRGDFDAADDWIVAEAKEHDIVITSDILLADRLVRAKVRVLGPKGDEFTEDNVGSAVALRELNQNLRYSGQMHGGPKPMDKRDRSNFLGALDRVVQSARRAGAL